MKETKQLNLRCRVEYPDRNSAGVDLEDSHDHLRPRRRHLSSLALFPLFDLPFMLRWNEPRHNVAVAPRPSLLKQRLEIGAPVILTNKSKRPNKET